MGTQSEKYRVVEDTTYAQLRQIQDLIDNAIMSGNAANIRTYVSCQKDLFASLRDTVRERQLSAIQEGQLLPISVLRRYKTAFYPRLQTGIEDMRLTIESLLPTTMRAEFKKAWHDAYTRYIDAARDAENAINDYETLAKEEALSLAYANNNNKAIGTNVVKAGISNDKKKRNPDDMRRSRERKKASN